MPVVDYESVVADLRAHIVSERSHGQRGLLQKLAELEARHRVDEGLPEKALRLYGSEIFEIARQSAKLVDRGPKVVIGNGDSSRSLGGTDGQQSGTRSDAA